MEITTVQVPVPSSAPIVVAGGAVSPTLPPVIGALPVPVLAMGPAGSPGASGASGTTWYEGSGVPNNTFGINGDFYLDTSTGNIYQKAVGTWF